MAPSARSFPEGWADDPVTDFIEQAHENSFAAFVHFPDFFRRLIDLDALYRKAVQFFGRPDDWLIGVFLLRTHAALLGATRLATSGQVPESYMVLRSALETSLYALYIQRDPSRAQTWFKRSEGEEARKLARNEFAISKPLSVLSKENPALHSWAKELYDLCIEQGGHPNVDAFMAQMQVRTKEEGIHLDLNYLSGPTTALQLCLKSLLRTGIVSLRIIEQVVPQRFEILGISSQLRHLQEGL
jgi:hypothetical protein